MSEVPVSVRRSRLRTWIVLVASFVGLLLVSVVGVWLWLRSDGDVRAIEAEVLAAGFAVQPKPQTFTDPLRLAQARSADAAVRAIKIEGPGQVNSLQNKSASAEFRAYHQAISSQRVCDAARGIIALGKVPIRVPPGKIGFYPFNWNELFDSRLVVAEGDELDLCLAVTQVRIEMAWGDDSSFWGRLDITHVCKLLTHRLADRREQLRPMAGWLETMAQRCLDSQPTVAQPILHQDLASFRHGEQMFRERGMRLPDWLKSGIAIEMAMRVERASILRNELSWLQFLKAHPAQPRVWLDEAERRRAALANAGSWLGANLHQQLLVTMDPRVMRGLVSAVLYARLLSAEIRGSPWPVDLCDRAGNPLRRWEKDGQLIGAYSVGPDGVDDGADNRKDILLRLVLDPPPAP
jgi:hypothetical protein